MAVFAMGLADSALAQQPQVPEEGQSRHDFFYAGMSMKQRMFIVKDDRVGWEYNDTEARGEISVVIPQSVSKIDVHAFGGCYALTSIVVQNPQCAIAPDAFPKNKRF